MHVCVGGGGQVWIDGEGAWTMVGGLENTERSVLVLGNLIR